MPSKDLPPLTSGALSMFIKSQLLTTIPPPPEGTNLSGTTCMITGANTGIGFECARQYLKLNISHLIVTARTDAKGQAAVQKLREGFPKAKVEAWALDMCSYDSIQALVKRVESDVPRLDHAILNAGCNRFEFGKVPSTGHSETVQVNYLSTVLLATLLLPVMKSKASPGSASRLSIVSSGTTLHAKLPNAHCDPFLASFDDPKTAPPIGLDCYSASKLLGQMWLYKAADFVSADDVIVNLVDPGGTRGTALGRDLPKVVQLIVSGINRLVARTPTAASHTYIDATTAKGKESHGSFVMDAEVRPFPKLLYTDEGKRLIDKLWEETMNEFEFVDMKGVLASMKT